MSSFNNSFISAYSSSNELFCLASELIRSTFRPTQAFAYLYENTVDKLSASDRKWAVEEVFHLVTELLFPSRKVQGGALARRL